MFGKITYPSRAAAKAKKHLIREITSKPKWSERNLKKDNKKQDNLDTILFLAEFEDLI